MERGLALASAYYWLLGIVCGTWLLVRFRDDPSYAVPLEGASPVAVFCLGCAFWPFVLILMATEDDDKER